MRRKVSLLMAVFCCLAMPAQTEKLPAFPGAEGFGRYVTGGRGGTVYHVTSLADSGEGSLRAAVEAGGTRTIVFDVSGTIFLQSELKLTNGNVTIAGQTAPGDGICVADYPFTINANNVIVRYMRMRLGNKYVSDENDGWDGFGALDQKNIIIDHCSVSWSIDECLSMSGCENITVQWCLVAQSLQASGHSKGNHGYGGNWGGKHSSYHHNLLAHHGSRTPRLGPRPTTQLEEYMDMRNNVIYNWAGNGCYGGEGMKVNIVNNYYKPGPATDTRSETIRKRIAAVGCRTTEYVTTYPAYADALHLWGKYYVAGNVNPDHADVTGDNWTYGMYNQIDASGNDGTYTATTRDTIRLAAPLDYCYTTTHSAADAYSRVLAYAGASLSRDSYDATMADDARNRRATYTGSRSGILPGIIDSQDEAGGWPSLSGTPSPADTDGDGMPDAWEEANGLDKGDATDGPKTAENGYTNLENYLNSLVADITAAQNAGGTTGGYVEYEAAEMDVADAYQIDASTYSGTAGGQWLFEDDYSITTPKGYATGNYSTLKYSSGQTFTITIPNGLAIERVKFEGYDNYNTADASITLTADGKSVGSSYVFPMSRETTVHTIDLPTAATKTIAFKVGGNQTCLKIALYPVKNEMVTTGGVSSTTTKTVTGTITLPFYDGNTDFAVDYSNGISGKIAATVSLGSALGCTNRRKVNGANFNDISTTEKKAASGNSSNALTINLQTTSSSVTFKPTKISFNACKVGTDGGKFDLSLDNTALYSGQEPNRNNEEKRWYSTYEKTLSSSAATDHSFVFNIYGLDSKPLGLGNIVITGELAYEETTLEGQTTAVTLKENARVLGIGSGQANVTLHRQLGTTWNTLCLPFSLTAAQIENVWGKAEIYALTSVHGTVLHFDPVGSIEAGVPYLMKVEKVVTKPRFEQVDITALAPQTVTFGDYSMVGTYVRYGMTYGGTELMMQTSGALAKPKNSPDNWMKGLRAYFVVPAAASSEARVSILGVVSGLAETGARIVESDDRVFNLHGQLVGRAGESLPMGIYVRQGKKIVVR